jgi:transposase
MIAYHPRAKTTVEIRKEIKENKEGLSVREQAKKYNVSVSTIMKWRKRDTPYERHGTRDLYKKHISITPLEEHIICEIRKTTLLGIDELVEIVNQIGIKVTRSGLYRALKRNGLSNIRELLKSFDKETKEEIKEFKKYEPGYLHIDVKVLPKINKERKYLFVSIDRATRLVYIEIRDKKDAKNGAEFLENAIKYYPYKITKVLTDNGGEFTNKTHYKYNDNNDNNNNQEQMKEEENNNNIIDKTKETNNNQNKKSGKKINKKTHLFDKICEIYNIEHRLTKPYHPQTNGMVERMNRKIEENVLKLKYKDYKELEQALYRYWYNYNHYIKHSGLNYKTPIEKLKEYYEKKPEMFTKKFDEFAKEQKSILYTHSVELDNYSL